MGRAALSHEERETFRRSMRDVATRRFAAHGERGVTMRALADDLGVSPMTAYRYFADKDEIFDMVRAAAVEAFVASQERAFATERDPIARLRVLARAYVDHALAEPDQYRVMFQLEQPERSSARAAALGALERRSWLPMRTTVGEAIESGLLLGDPDELAHLCWATLHGLVSLHLAGKLRLDRTLADLVTPAIDHLIGSARSTPRRRSR